MSIQQVFKNSNVNIANAINHKIHKINGLWRHFFLELIIELSYK